MKANDVVSKKIQIKIDNISFLQKQLKDYDFLSEEDILILLKKMKKQLGMRCLAILKDIFKMMFLQVCY